MNKNKILVLISEALEVDSSKINMDTKLGDLEEWDSLGQLSILTELDKLFDGKVAEINEMAEADSVESIIYLLKNKGLI